MIQPTEILYYTADELVVLLKEYSIRGDFAEQENAKLSREAHRLDGSIVKEVLKEMGYLYSLSPTLDILTHQGTIKGEINEDGEVEWIETLLPALATAISNKL